jgi:hypothetical protein
MTELVGAEIGDGVGALEPAQAHRPAQIRAVANAVPTDIRAHRRLPLKADSKPRGDTGSTELLPNSHQEDIRQFPRANSAGLNLSRRHWTDNLGHQAPYFRDFDRLDC